MSGANEWWRSFFEEAFGQLQLAGVLGERVEAEVDFFETVLEPGSRVLDVPCGPGRHCLELARRGFRVAGLDLNPAVVEAARQAASAEGFDMDLRVGDMRSLDCGPDFDAVLCWWGSFGYFDDEGDLKFLRGAARALRPGGKFLLDVHVAESLYPMFRERDWHWWDGTDERFRVIQERAFNLETSRVESEWTILGDGPARTGTSSIRIYTHRELLEALRAAGFDSFEATDAAGDTFQLGSRRLVLVATRAR